MSVKFEESDSYPSIKLTPPSKKSVIFITFTLAFGIIMVAGAGAGMGGYFFYPSEYLFIGGCVAGGIGAAGFISFTIASVVSTKPYLRPICFTPISMQADDDVSFTELRVDIPAERMKKGGHYENWLDFKGWISFAKVSNRRRIKLLEKTVYPEDKKGKDCTIHLGRAKIDKDEFKKKLKQPLKAPPIVVTSDTRWYEYGLKESGQKDYSECSNAYIVFANDKTFGGGIFGNAQEETIFTLFPECMPMVYAGSQGGYYIPPENKSREVEEDDFSEIEEDNSSEVEEAEYSDVEDVEEETQKIELKKNSYYSRLHLLPVRLNNPQEPEPYFIFNTKQKHRVDSDIYGTKISNFKISDIPNHVHTDQVSDQEVTLVGIAAKRWPITPKNAYSKDNLLYHLKTVYTAIKGLQIAEQNKSPEDRRPIVIHTGKWGCGVFNNSVRTMTQLTILAAKMAGNVGLVFHGDAEEGYNDDFFMECSMRVDELQTPEAVFTFIEDEQKTDPSWAPLRHYQTKPAEVKESAKKKDAEDVIEEEDEIEVNNDK